MITIKKVAGDILLYFYYLQRNDYSFLNDFVLSFQMRHFSKNEKSPMVQKKEHKIYQNLIKIGENDNNIYNALIYLKGKDFLYLKNTQDNVFDMLFNFRLTAQGFDIIEGIERGEGEKKTFNINFNIKVDNNFNVESLIKFEIGKILSLI